ncbi:MAG: YdcF family protein [Ruminococcaceae bacterium]|nr:YdcF family protein [Oscillospiraceae bacterium]
MKKFLRIAAAAVCLLAAAYFLLPLTMGVLHIGMVYPAAIFLLCAAALLFPAAVRRLFAGKLRRAAIAATAVLSAAVVCVLAVCVLIGTAADDPPAEGEEVTVVVLGCQVSGDRPSVMLQARIDAAYEYLAAHPNAVCIATGGKGTGENISEAACIRQELVAMGIDAGRIYMEDRSVNTAQNMAFSAGIIEEKGLSTTVAVVSDNFHQLRASIFAARVGLDARAVGCSSHWMLGGGYWTREVLALGAAFIRGY